MAKRRGHGEGSISQRSDGRWCARISLGWKNRRRQVQSIYGATRADVAKQLRTQLKRVDEGQPIGAPAAPTLAVYAERWLTGERDTLRPSTIKFYRDNLTNHVLPALGTLRLSAIRRTQVLELTRGLTGLSPVARSGVRRTLSACLGAAIDEELIESNPCRSTRRKSGRGNTARPEPDPLTREEARLLAETARQHFADWFPFVMVGLRTGLRLSELLALDWGDVDWTGARLHVERAIVREYLGPPKSGSARHVDLSPEAMTALRTHRSGLAEQWLALGLPAPGIVFPAPTGERLTQDRVRSMLARICAKAGVRYRGPHAAFRDTFATALLTVNVPLIYVSSQLGHADPAVTLRHYTRWLPRPDARHVAVLDECVSGCVSAEAV